MALDDIYTEIITEHSRSTRNKHHIEAPTAVLQGVNPSCGDEISLEIREENGVIADAAFTGMGCAISQASASIMVDLIKGQPVAEAMRLAQLFLGMITGTETEDAVLEELDEAIALRGIAKMPARVKCAVLPWHTLENAMKQ